MEVKKTGSPEIVAEGGWKKAEHEYHTGAVRKTKV